MLQCCVRGEHHGLVLLKQREYGKRIRAKIENHSVQVNNTTINSMVLNHNWGFDSETVQNLRIQHRQQNTLHIYIQVSWLTITSGDSRKGRRETVLSRGGCTPLPQPLTTTCLTVVYKPYCCTTRCWISKQQTIAFRIKRMSTVLDSQHSFTPCGDAATVFRMERPSD